MRTSSIFLPPKLTTTTSRKGGKTILFQNPFIIPTCKIIGVTSGSLSTGNATPVIKEKPGGDSKNSLFRASDGRRPSGKCLSYQWDGGIFKTGGPSTFQVLLKFQDPV